MRSALGGGGDTVRGEGDASCNVNDAGRIGSNADHIGGDASRLGDNAEVVVAGVTDIGGHRGGNVGVDGCGGEDGSIEASMDSDIIDGRGRIPRR